mmetsp:Transcript_2276/g.4201  ORF Transcript_2276/g.4201 Transcript_2276/m.4201 type:complete len:537 (-) Transcript_2276:237-1847(-)
MMATRALTARISTTRATAYRSGEQGENKDSITSTSSRAAIDMCGNIVVEEHTPLANQGISSRKPVIMMQKQQRQETATTNTTKQNSLFRRRRRRQQPAPPSCSQQERYRNDTTDDASEPEEEFCTKNHQTFAEQGQPQQSEHPLSFLTIRERLLQRWQHHSKPTTSSSNNKNTNLLFASSSDATLAASSSNGSTFYCSLRRLSSLKSWGSLSSSLHHLGVSTGGIRIPTVVHEIAEEEDEQRQPQQPPQELHREDNPQDISSPSHPPISPTTSSSRFFATPTLHQNETLSPPLIQVQEVRLVDNAGQTGTYTGTLLESKPHGTGIMVYQDEGLIYDGQWYRGDWCGMAKLMDTQNGHVYEGGFFDNYKHGLGVLQYADGRIYDGIFALGVLEGKGHLEYPDGTKYWGHWTSDGVEHGRGKKMFVDGREFDGEFLNGIMHGHGRMTFPDGSWYLGEWIDGEPNGLGMSVEPDGRLLFEGTFCHGKPIEGSSFPNSQKKSEGDFLLYRSSVAKHGGTLVGNIPKQVMCMRQDKLLHWQ